jgi:hypothetical protein
MAFWNIFDSFTLSSRTADPSSPVDGQAWYNSTSSLFKFRQGGVSTALSTGIVLPLVTQTTGVTIANYNELHLCSASGASFTLVLPTAVGQAGKILEFIRTDQTLANAVTIDGATTETIDGNLTRKLATQYERMVIVSDNTNWVILERTNPQTPTSFTPTIYGTTTNPTRATTNTEYANWTRYGKFLNFQYSYQQSATTGAASGSGTYLFSLPSGLTVDGTFIDKLTAGDETAVVGSCAFRGNASTTQVAGYAMVFDNGAGKEGVLLEGVLEGGGNMVVLSSTSYGFAGNAVLRFGFQALIPITGWE